MFLGNIKKVLPLILILIILFNSLGSVCASGLLASPTDFKYDMKPIQSVSGEVTVTNTGNVSMNITVTSKKLLIDSLNMVYSDDGIAKWIALGVNSFTLSPGESKSIPFTVTSPAQINYSDAVGAIIITGVPPENNSSLSSLAIRQGIELVIPIVVGLPGKIIESLQLIQHSAPTVLISYMPGEFTYQLYNNGTVYANMTGNIEINGLLSRHSAQIQGGIYPGDNYTLVSKWTPGFADFGLYSADTNINYGREQQDKTLQTHDTILVIPVWLIVLLILAGAIWIIRKKEIESPFKIKIERKK